MLLIEAGSRYVRKLNELIPLANAGCSDFDDINIEVPGFVGNLHNTRFVRLDSMDTDLHVLMCFYVGLELHDDEPNWVERAFDCVRKRPCVGRIDLR